MDALSDLLKSVRLEGAVYLNAEFTAPWCIRGECSVTSVRRKLAHAEQLVFFHMLTAGRCKVRLTGGVDVLDAVAGDLILITRDEPHLLGSHLHLAPTEVDSMAEVEITASGDLVHLRHGGGGEATRFVCGYLACSRSVCRPLFDALPRVLRIPIGDGPATSLLRELLRVGVRESSMSAPGADSMLAKLSELIFVEAMRRHVEQLPQGAKGWLAGVRDPQVGTALALLHREPGRGWTVDELAHEVALSRSALAERFNALVGEPPMQYLTRWRLALAAQQLRAGRAAISRIAEHSGYESETAFSRAFKREFGVPPAAWRKSNPQTPDAARPA
ncbi:AraC family transcriptional regulator [Hydrocarboniphaga sp.]|uniref:AraC family transcriptional regulator n=1 Tax=Hydrocarboniphaga sp. TaxID=2033016 RepID=UPI003D0D4B95